MAKTLCLDFDDTLCAHDKQPLPNAQEVCAGLRAAGHQLLVSSARFSPIYGDLNRFRIKKVQDWLDEHSIVVDRVCRFVPQADVYIDDLAYRFEGAWEVELPRVLDLLVPGASSNARPIEKQVNLALDVVWSGDAPTDGAVAALETLAARKVRVAVCAGPHLEIGPDDTVAPPTRSLREAMTAAGLKLKRIDADKFSSDLYVRGRRIISSRFSARHRRSRQGARREQCGPF